MCIGIIRDNSLVGGRAWAESNPGHWAHHAVLHMAAECINHSATRAGNSGKQPDRPTTKMSNSFQPHYVEIGLDTISRSQAPTVL